MPVCGVWLYDAHFVFTIIKKHERSIEMFILSCQKKLLLLVKKNLRYAKNSKAVFGHRLAIPDFVLSGNISGGYGTSALILLHKRAKLTISVGLPL